MLLRLAALCVLSAPLAANDNVGGFCFVSGPNGDLCPCGGGNGGATGCPNALHPEWGAVLDANGTASVSADSLQLAITAVPPNCAMVICQSEHALGYGIPFGDGLRCMTGQTMRLALIHTTPNVPGRFYPQVGEPSISQLGAVPAGGGYRAYQVWYRSAQPFCTPATFNMTSAVGVNWTP